MKRILCFVLVLLMLLPLLIACDSGADGADGTNGIDGKNGTVVTIGENGNWFLDGVDTGVPATGAAGVDGKTPYIGENGHWWIGDIDTMVTADGKPAAVAPVTPDKEHEYRILFIGNSYTHYNTMPTAIFEPMVKAAGYKIKVDAITKGGHTLLGHADPKDETGAKVAEALSAANYGKYDYVIIQEQSDRPASSIGYFYDGVRAIAAMAREIGATPVLYGTWAKKTGHESLSTYGWTNETMTWKMAASYTAIGEQLDVEVAYAGLAFYDVYTNYGSTVELYDEDLTHPSYAGSYLAASALFATIFNTDPTTVNYRGNSQKISADAVGVLQAAAKRAVFDTPAIPEPYLLDAMGVTSKYELNDKSSVNLTAKPASSLLSVKKSGGSITPLGGTSGTVCSREYSTTILSMQQKEDIANINNGLSVIGLEKMNNANSLSNLVDGKWGSGNASYMSNMTFDNNRYDIDGSVGGKYTALITLNLGQLCTFDAVGFASGKTQGLPGAVEVFVSKNGVSWSRVATACWDNVNGTAISSVSDVSAVGDLVDGSAAGAVCLFDMNGVEGQYVRLGIVLGRNDEMKYYNTVNTRELLVYGTVKNG